MFDGVDVTPYERMIIELLATIDDEEFRMHCTQILDAHVTRPWRAHVYGDNCLFTQATLAGNLGLIQCLNASRIKQHGCYDTLAIAAARENHWSVVAYFHAQHPLKKNSVNQLLHMAVTQGVSHAIPTLFRGDRRMPTLRAIEQVFKLAVKKNDIDSVVCLMSSPQQPCDSIMASAYRCAIKFNYVDIARAIAERASGKCLQAAIEQTRIKSSPPYVVASSLQQHGFFKNEHLRSEMIDLNPVFER